MYYIRRAILIAGYVSLPVAGGLFLFSKPLVSLLFERGAFLAESTAMTAGCLAFYAVGIPFYALREIGARALSANMEQKKVLKNTILSVIANVLLNILLCRPLNYVGLALATSLSGLMAAVLSLMDLRKLGLIPFNSTMLRDFVKISIASILSLLLCGVCYGGLDSVLGDGVAIIVGAGMACLCYVVISIALRIEVFIWTYRHLPGKFQILPGLREK